MRVATSIYAVEAALGDYREKLAAAYLEATGRCFDGDKLGLHWVLAESETACAKSPTSLLKSDPCQYLGIGLSRRRFALRLSAKPETGRVWTSDPLPGKIVPAEVAMALQKRAGPAQAKWRGPMVDIYMPMHQKHPGLAEHAIVGAIRLETGEVVCFVTDRPDPMQASSWHIYKFHPSRRVAQTMLASLEREGQRDFRSTLTGQELQIRGFKGERLSSEEIVAALGGVKKFAWQTDAGSCLAGIPATARRFKLGEELCAQERKAMPSSVLIGALDASLKR
jgi:hypothetical protein